MARSKSKNSLSLFSFISLLICSNAFAGAHYDTLSASQSMSIGSNSAAASAAMDIVSTTKGFNPPRMTTTQKNAISAPTDGMMVFDTTLSLLGVYASGWTSVGGANSVGTAQIQDGAVTQAKLQPRSANAPIATAGNMAVSPYGPGPNSLLTTNTTLLPTTYNVTVTITIASPAVITNPALSSGPLYVGMPVIFSTSGALPTGITAGTTYYVSNVLSSTTFRISATHGGSDVNTSGSQSGTQTAKLAVYSNQITTTGRPVIIQLVPDTTQTTTSIVNGQSMSILTGGPGGISTGYVTVVRAGTTSGTLSDIVIHGASTANEVSDFPCPMFTWIDPVGAGTYEYVLNWGLNPFATSSILRIAACQLVAYEM